MHFVPGIALFFRAHAIRGNKGVSRALWPFQKYGVGFLIDRHSYLLGDKISCEKTIRAIAAAIELRNRVWPRGFLSSVTKPR